MLHSRSRHNTHPPLNPRWTIKVHLHQPTSSIYSWTPFAKNPQIFPQSFKAEADRIARLYAPIGIMKKMAVPLGCFSGDHCGPRMKGEDSHKPRTPTRFLAVLADAQAVADEGSWGS